MARVMANEQAELESFWRSHLGGWRRSDLNLRVYCEARGPPLKRFGNWRARLKHEEPAPAGKLLYRRRRGLQHMFEHLRNKSLSAPSSYIPSGRSVRRRIFSEADKWRILRRPAANAGRSPVLSGSAASVRGCSSPGGRNWRRRASLARLSCAGLRCRVADKEFGCRFPPLRVEGNFGGH